MAQLSSAERVVRLPAVVESPVSAEGGAGDYLLLSHSDSSEEILRSPLAIPFNSSLLPPPLSEEGEERGSFFSLKARKRPIDSQEIKPRSEYREGFFQKILFSETYLPRWNEAGFVQNDLQFKMVVALPCPSVQSPLVITPFFQHHELLHDSSYEMPRRLMDAGMQFRWLTQATPLWGVDLAVTPGVYGDFEKKTDKIYRVTAHAIAAYTLNERTKVVFGAAYLDRPDAVAIPVGGIIWNPREEWNIQLLFPEPKIAYRIQGDGFRREESETWLSLCGEFAGDEWAFERRDGSVDQIVLSDARILLGVERKVYRRLGAKFECGYVFNRRVRYSSDASAFEPEDTILFRGTLFY